MDRELGSVPTEVQSEGRGIVGGDELGKPSENKPSYGLVLTSPQIFNFALAFFLPPAFKNITWKTYIIFGVCKSRKTSLLLISY